LARWIDKYVITEDVKIENYTNKFLILDIIGPQAESYLTLICGKDVDELTDNKLHKVFIEETPAHLLKKKALSGESLYWLVSEVENSEILLDYLLSHKSVFDLEMIGEDSFDRYRVINKVLKFGKEISDNYNPHEANLLDDVSFKKGCYIGQEVIARLDTYDKVQKYLKRFVINNNDLILPAELFSTEKELVTIITTLTKNHENNEFEGLGYFKKSFIEKSKEFELSPKDKLNQKYKIRLLD
ncbi:MAG: hypothetical protein KDC90_13730, partial [Ignavibacteriae bacterium]|nr:hypothetical protein [Ignavibacteriota bacterium]